MALKDRLLNRLDMLIELGQHADSFPDAALCSEFFTGASALVESVFPHQHVVRTKWDSLEPWERFIPRALGILRAARTEIDGDWIPLLSGLLAGEVFDDFLDMAAHLNGGGYKDAAA